MQPVAERNEENKGGILVNADHDQEMTIDQELSVTSLEESSTPHDGSSRRRLAGRPSGTEPREARQCDGGEDRPYWHHQSNSSDAPDLAPGWSESPARALQSDTPMEQSAPHEVHDHSHRALLASQASQSLEKGTGRNLQRIIDQVTQSGEKWTKDQVSSSDFTDFVS